MNLYQLCYYTEHFTDDGSLNGKRDIERQRVYVVAPDPSRALAVYDFPFNWTGSADADLIAENILVVPS